MKLKDWIKIEPKFILCFVSNPNSYNFMINNQELFADENILNEYVHDIYYIKENGKWKQMINWSVLCKKASDIYSINLLRANIDKIDWEKISSNPYAIDILKENIDKIDWNELYDNYNAIYLITDDMKTLTWNEIYNKLDYLCDKYLISKKGFINTFSLTDNKYVLRLLYENPNEINWINISKNINAINIIDKYIEKIWFSLLCSHENKIDYILEHFEKYDKKEIDKNNDFLRWNECYLLSHRIGLSENPLALEYLKNNPDKISYLGLYANPNIFEYDYEMITNKISIYKEELLRKVLEPNRLMKICNRYGIDFCNFVNNF